MKPTLNGIFTVWSNSPGTPTGYGEQAKLLVDRLARDAKGVAAISNYGLEGNVGEYKTPYGVLPHYPRGLDPYSQDVGPMHHAHFVSQHKKTPNAMIGLYDSWVIKGSAWDKLNLGWWTPLDHISLPPLVEKFLRRKNVTPIAMAKHGVEQMNAKGIECEYVPHGIDTKIFKPTMDIQGMNIRDYMGTKDNFVVGMVAANKASGLLHRKAFSENILAFSIFWKKHPEARLYLHTDPLGSAQGWNLLTLIESLGIPKDVVLFPPFVDYKYGIAQQDLAAFYSGIDVLLAAGYGEGFGVPTVEAQACGTRVIGSSWAATKDLVADDGWLVEGQPTWDAGQNAWWSTPLVPSIVSALEEAFAVGISRSKVAQDFAAGFDADLVWERDWLPVLGRLLEKSK
jgi:glycosyltransferase involved in cell wall biosynthesis